MQWCQAQSPSAGINLNALLGDAQAVGSNHPSDFVARSACGNYSECEKDDLYFALNQADFDGHDCVDEAVRRGVKAVVCERLLPISIPQLIVPDTRVAYGQACQALAGNPSQRMNLIGVSGTVGKTVTSHLVHSILEKAGHSSGLASSIETRKGDSRPEKPGSDPINSVAIASQLSQMCIGRCTHAVLEMPSIPLAQRAFSGVELDAAVITNIQRGNLAIHGNLQNCLQANSRILDCLKPTGFAVVNADDRHSMELLNYSSSPTLTFGIHKPAEVTAKILERNGSFQTFVISAGTESIVIRTSVIGKHHIYNCLAATAVALTMGIELHVIATGLESASLPGRMERIDCGQSFGVWVDSAVSPSQLNGAISAITPICEGRLWCICSTESSQSPEERKLIGEMLERTIEKPIITQTSPTQSIDYEPCHQVLDGFSKPESAHVMPDRQKAIEWALTHAKPQDAVLIVGAGQQANGPFGQAKVKLTDREICQTFLCKQGEHREILRQEIFRIDDYR